jgi:diguanylate cyclase (GGDEF)-like protein
VRGGRVKLTKFVWISRGYLALGALSIPIFLLGGESVQFLITAVAILSGLPAVWIAWRHHGLPTPFIAALSLIGAIYIGSTVATGSLRSGVALVITTPLDLGASVLIIGLFAYLATKRRGRFTSGDFLDAVILGLGAWLVAWIALIQPYLSLDDQMPLGLIPNALYLPMAAPLLALAAAIAFSSSLRRPAPLLLAAGTVMNVFAGAIHALFEVGHAGPGAQTLANALYLPAFALSAAAFVHPTALDIVSTPPDPRHLQLPGRLALTGLSLTLPILVMAWVPTDSTADRVVRSASAVAVLILVSLRLATATRSHLEAQQHLIASARTDLLTGLPNRIAMLEAAQESIDSAWSTKTQPSVYLIDIDRFKNTNDSLGHAAGDEALQVIAQRLLTVADRVGAKLGRPAGDEFLVIDTTTTGSGEAMVNADAFQDVFKTPVPLDAGVMFLTASIGVATMRRGRNVEPADLFRQADIAMYRAKDAGRNCLALYHESMQERLKHRMAIETALHGALEQRELRLYHQPIVDTGSGRVSGFEALMRWQRSDGSLMSPAEFIPVAEESGIITSIGAWALLEALTQLRTWIDDDVVGPTTNVSVNVSARQLADPAFCDVVEEALTRSGLPAHLLWLEVTETMMINNPELAKDTLTRIRSTGVRIALDDFGTGYSSLSLLQQFPIQRVKIDRAFVKGVAESSNDRSLVRTIIAMGSSMGLDIVAEGVETVEQLKMLRKLGCDKAQGFLISHPVPAEAMRTTVAALESLSQWEAFDDVLGDRPTRPTRIT